MFLPRVQRLGGRRGTKRVRRGANKNVGDDVEGKFVGGFVGIEVIGKLVGAYVGAD